MPLPFFLRDTEFGLGWSRYFVGVVMAVFIIIYGQVRPRGHHEHHLLCCVYNHLQPSGPEGGSLSRCTCSCAVFQIERSGCGVHLDEGQGPGCIINQRPAPCSCSPFPSSTAALTLSQPCDLPCSASFTCTHLCTDTHPPLHTHTHSTHRSKVGARTLCSSPCASTRCVREIHQPGSG